MSGRWSCSPSFTCRLNFGQIIAKGTPTEIQNNPEVIKAYLGGGKEG